MSGRVEIRKILYSYNVFKGCDAYNSIIQGAWTYTIDNGQVYCFVYVNNSNAQNDEIQYKFTHKRGSFTFVLLHQQDANRAIATVILDNVTQGTIDMYSAGLVRNVVSTVPLTILRDGEHTLSLRTATRNVLSIGWYLVSTAFWIRD